MFVLQLCSEETINTVKRILKGAVAFIVLIEVCRICSCRLRVNAVEQRINRNLQTCSSLLIICLEFRTFGIF